MNLDLVSLAFVRPTEALRRAAAGSDGVTGYAVLLAAAVLGGLSRAAATSGGGWVAGGFYPTTLFLFWVAASLTAALSLAAVLHVTATLLGGNVPLRGFLPAFGLSYAPNLFSGIPVALGNHGFAFAGGLVAGLLVLAHVVLIGAAVQQAHRLSVGRTILVLLLPGLVLSALGLFSLLPAVGWILQMVG